MDRWARKHRSALEADLDEGEILLDADRALLGAAGRIDLDPAHRGGRPGRRRRGVRGLAEARALSVDLPARSFVLGVTDRRIVVWRATRGVARPIEVVTSIPVATVAGMRAGPRLGPSRLHVVLDHGVHLTLRPLGFRRLDHLADAYNAARSGRAHGRAPDQTTSTDSA